MNKAKRAKEKVVRKPRTAPETVNPKWPMEEREVDPDAPYFGLSKEEFERLTPWRKVSLDPEMERIIDWIILNRRAIRAGTI